MQNKTLVISHFWVWYWQYLPIFPNFVDLFHEPLGKLNNRKICETRKILIKENFETFWWLSKFSFHHKWNGAWLLVKNWYIRIVSRVTERLKTWDVRKLRTIRKISKLHRIIAKCLVPLLKWTICQYSQKPPEKQELNFSSSALFHMKTSTV